MAQSFESDGRKEEDGVQHSGTAVSELSLKIQRSGSKEVPALGGLGLSCFEGLIQI